MRRSSILEMRLVDIAALRSMSDRIRLMKSRQPKQVQSFFSDAEVSLRAAAIELQRACDSRGVSGTIQRQPHSSTHGKV